VETQGVLHRVSCRDNAWPSSGQFSVMGFDSITAWHEFHHAAYFLNDEYCCDGGYGLPLIDSANEYSSLGTCQAKSVQAATCLPIQCTCPPAPASCAGVCFPPFSKNTGRWRSDPDPDLMKSGVIEQGDDMRAAIQRFVQCQLGGC
jgi:hypothetical protein